MIKNTIKILVSIGLLTVISTVFADNRLINFKPGFYLGVQSGLVWLGDTSAARDFMDEYYKLNGSKSEEEDKGKYGIKFLAGYSFFPYFACDLGWGLYPSHKITVLNGDGGGLRYKRDLQVFDISGKGILPLEIFSSELSDWYVYGKLGIAVNKHNYAKNIMYPSGTVIDVTSKDHSYMINIGLSYALGIAYNFNQHFAVDLSWSGVYLGKGSKFFYDNDRSEYVFDGGMPSFNFIAIGITYKF